MSSSGGACTTQGLANTLPTPTISLSDADLSSSNTHTAAITTTAAASTPISSRNCYDEWVHINLAHDNTPTTGTYIQCHVYTYACMCMYICIHRDCNVFGSHNMMFIMLRVLP